MRVTENTANRAMMINETILLLVYYYDYEYRNHRFLKDIVKKYCPAYLPFNLYLYEPLQKIFSRVILYDYLKRRAEIGIKSMNKEIIDIVRKEHLRYVLWTSFYYDVQPSTLKRIRKEGSIVIGWFFDDEWRFDSYSKYWIPYLDYCVTNAIEAVPKYKELGAQVIQTIPNTGIAINPELASTEEKYNVSFVGSRFYVNREQWISELENRKIPIHFFGEGWGGYVPFEEMIDIFRTSKINLNFSSAGPEGRVKQIKGRVFQVCMAGGFLLTEYAPGLEKYFEIDREIVCFHYPEEMIDKIAYYLGHDEERRAIVKAGWMRAANKYTSFYMLVKVFREIEEDKNKRQRVTPKLKIPVPVRKNVFDYHFTWRQALLAENYIEENVSQSATSGKETYNPLVSIITPVRNGIKYLEMCIQSVLNQTYLNIEHIFVDGGSTDGTLEMLSSYQAKYPDRIRFITGVDKGVGNAVSKGYKVSRGEIIGWIDSDDIYELDAIGTVVKFFQKNSDASFVYGGCDIINEKGEAIACFIIKDFDFKEWVNCHHYILFCAIFYKRRVIEKVGYLNNLGNDLDFHLRVCRYFKMHRIEKKLTNWRWHSESISFKRAKREIKIKKERFRQDFFTVLEYTGNIFAPRAKPYLSILMEELRPYLGYTSILLQKILHL